MVVVVWGVCGAVEGRVWTSGRVPLCLVSTWKSTNVSSALLVSRHQVYKNHMSQIRTQLSSQCKLIQWSGCHLITSPNKDLPTVIMGHILKYRCKIMHTYTTTIVKQYMHRAFAHTIIFLLEEAKGLYLVLGYH